MQLRLLLSCGDFHCLSIADSSGNLKIRNSTVNGLLSQVNARYLYHTKCDEYIGSTSGIGKEYADYLAKKGMSVMIISRSEDRLKEQAEELRKAYKAEIKYIAHDFTNVGAPKEDFYRKLEAECVVMDKNGGIGLLINNVGIANQYPQLEREITEKEALDMINCNIDSTVFMTKAILKFMEARNSGGIVNVSSQSVRRTFVCIFV